MGTTLKTQAEIAKFFDVKPSTVRIEWRPDDMPGEPGAYDLKAIFDWWRPREERKWKAKREKESDFEKEWKKYRALKAEVEYKKTTGELVERERLATSLLRFATAVKAKAYAMIPALAAEMEDLDEKQRLVSITQHIETYLEGLALEFDGGQKSTRPKPVKTGRPRKARARA